MNLLKIAFVLFLVVFTAWFVPFLWSGGFRFSAVLVAALYLNVLFLIWWHEAVQINVRHDEATAAQQKK